ncbi:MAG: hypothetical protein ABW277_23125 [Longimicrobiaceae bacterium]
MLRLLVAAEAGQNALIPLSLDEIVREGVRRLLAVALEAMVSAYLEAHQAERDACGRALLVRNGRPRPRKITLGSVTVENSAPRLNDLRVLDGVRQRFTSEILPRYTRRSPRVAEVLPIPNSAGGAPVQDTDLVARLRADSLTAFRYRQVRLAVDSLQTLVGSGASLDKIIDKWWLSYRC